MKINEKDIFLLITNKCNLKCFSCGYGCEKENNNWFISEEQFKTVLQKLKNTNLDGCTRYAINLTGGDPLMHKDWKKFAFLTKEMFPDCTCYIGTSGILLPSLPDEDLLECHKKGIRFGVTLYPSMKLLPMFRKIEEKFKRLGMLEYLTWNQIKILFGKPVYNETKNNTECFKRHFPNVDYCFVYQEKLYNCQNLFYQSLIANESNSSWVIQDILSDGNLKNKNTFKDCPNCKIRFEENVFWHFDIDVPDYCTLTSLKDLFLYNYNDYYLLQHDCKEHLECLNNEFFQKYFKKERLHPIIQKRFFNGKIDIFIPYNNYISYDFINLLLSQEEIDNCNIYLVSYTNDPKINGYVYDSFDPNGKNIFFLKANSYMESIHTFLNNSYLETKYCLDLNNYEYLNDKTFIKNI